MTPILIGSGLLILTIIMEVVFIETAQNLLNAYGNRMLGRGTFLRKVLVLSLVTLWLLLALSLAIWVWAIGFMAIGIFPELEPAVYFSLVTFTTLGLGGMEIPETWRLLSGFVGANGFLLLGLNTAVLIDVMARMRDGDMRTYKDGD